MTTTMTDTMPRPPKRNDLAAKIDADVLRDARIVAAYEGVPLAELLSETLRPILTKKKEHYQKLDAQKQKKGGN